MKIVFSRSEPLFWLHYVPIGPTHNSFHQHIGDVQYIPWNMHTVFALLCFVVVIHWLIFPYPSCLLHWHCGNLTIAPVPAKQPWWIWINTSCEFIVNDCITTTKQSTTKQCAYFLGYTVRGVKLCDPRAHWKLSRFYWACHFPEIHHYITDAYGNFSAIPSSNMVDNLYKRLVSVLSEIDRHIKRNACSPLWVPSIRLCMTCLLLSWCLTCWFRIRSVILLGQADTVTQGYQQGHSDTVTQGYQQAQYRLQVWFVIFKLFCFQWLKMRLCKSIDTIHNAPLDLMTFHGNSQLKTNFLVFSTFIFLTQ